MSYQRLAYDDAATSSEMTSDCHAVEASLHLPPPSTAARAVARSAPSLRFEDYPREVAKPTIAVSDAAARLAGALHLHLD